MAWTKFVDMEYDDEDKIDAAMPIPAPTPDYPYNLRFCLTDKELRKLELPDDCEVGDTLDMRIMAEVTSVSKDGEHCRIELQGQKIALEDENQEDEEK